MHTRTSSPSVQGGVRQTSPGRLNKTQASDRVAETVVRRNSGKVLSCRCMACASQMPRSGNFKEGEEDIRHSSTGYSRYISSVTPYIYAYPKQPHATCLPTASKGRAVLRRNTVQIHQKRALNVHYLFFSWSLNSRARAISADISCSQLRSLSRRQPFAFAIKSPSL